MSLVFIKRRDLFESWVERVEICEIQTFNYVNLVINSI